MVTFSGPPRVANRPREPFAINHAPAANTQATITQAAAGVGKRNVCTALTVILAAGTTAPAAAQVDVKLIDGASGGATILWEAQLSLQAVAGDRAGVALSGLWIEGTANTAMTLEFSAAGGANTFESVDLSGHVVQS